MDNVEKCYNLIQQNSAKGISAVDIADTLGKHRTTVHSYLNSLYYTGRAESRNGLWYPKAGAQTIRPLEKEIVIELPMPKNKWFDVARLQVHADYMEGLGMSGVADMEKTIIEKFNETRRIRITGKNVEDLDIEKVGNLILQANEKSAKVSFKRFLKNLKLPQLNNGAINKQNDSKKTEPEV